MKALKNILKANRKLKGEIEKMGKDLNFLTKPKGGKDPDGIHLLLALKEYVELDKKRDLIGFQLRQEKEKIKADIERKRMEKKQPLSLTITAPDPGFKAKSGSFIDIAWVISGPLGDRLGLSLLKNGIVWNLISGPSGVSKNDLVFRWSIPPKFPVGDYEISIKDYQTGVGSKVAIKIE